MKKNRIFLLIVFSFLTALKPNYAQKCIDHLAEIVDVISPDLAKNIDKEITLPKSFANAPPAEFGTWGKYIGQLPQDRRKKVVLNLLEKNHENSDDIVSIISELSPGPGVNRAIWFFFREGSGQNLLVNYNRTTFSRKGLMDMFGEERFSQFFPQLMGEEVRMVNWGAMRFQIKPQFTLGVFTAPGNYQEPPLRIDWMRRILLDSDLDTTFLNTINFRPALSYRNF